MATLTVEILATRYGDGRRKYTAGQVVEMDAEKARWIAATSGWLRIIPPPAQERRTATNKQAEARDTTAEVSKAQAKPSRRRRKKTK